MTRQLLFETPLSSDAQESSQHLLLLSRAAICIDKREIQADGAETMYSNLIPFLMMNFIGSVASLLVRFTSTLVRLRCLKRSGTNC